MADVDRLREITGRARTLSWSPDGSAIAGAADAVTWIGPPAGTTRSGPAIGVPEVAWSPDSRLIAADSIGPSNEHWSWRARLDPRRDQAHVLMIEPGESLHPHRSTPCAE
jgi:hypothetical protein